MYTPDKARILTDKKLEKLEKEISQIYKKSQKDIAEKWNKYMSSVEPKLKELQEAYEAAKKSGDKALIKETGKALGNKKIDVTLMNDRYKEMLKDTTYRLAEVNQIALNYVKDELPSIYAINYNAAKDIAKQVDMSFSIVNESVVKNLIKNGDLVLPQMEKRLNFAKDMRWNTKPINSSVLQGSIQGENINDISKRIFPEIMSKTDLKGKTEEEIKGIIEKNKQAAKRTARTTITGVENQGRLDSYKQLEEDGAVLKKVWMATGDGRTRDLHLDLDGQEVDIDDVFIDGDNNEIRYPGDPSAAPETVYNCRCSMVTNIIGFRKKDGRIEKIDYDPVSTRHEAEIEKEKEKREKEK